MTKAQAVAASLPDLPRWVDTRGMLLSGHATVLGFGSGDGFVVRAVHGAMSAVAVAGAPDASAIQEAVRGCTPMTPVIAQMDSAAAVRAALPDWTGERAIIHTLPREVNEAVRPSSTDARLLVRSERSRLAHLPAGLRHEMTHALDLAPVAAVFANDLPVSFCYPCWLTETLWDVSVDTLEDYRGRGLALSAFRVMYDHMRAAGRAPVWGALESNTASLRLAARIGFVATDEIVVFSRGHWAFLSGGFEEGD